MSPFIVYALTDPRTGEIRYVGKSTRGMKRPKQHGMPSVLTKDANTHKARWIRLLHSLGLDYGIQILEETTEADLANAEIFWIARGRALGWNLINHTDGGEGVQGLKRTPEQCERNAAAQRGRKASPETRAKLSAARLGKKRPPSVGEKVRAAKLGKKRAPFTEQAKANMSASQKARWEAYRKAGEPLH